jgi:hypothetical protein
MKHETFHNVRKSQNVGFLEVATAHPPFIEITSMFSSQFNEVQSAFEILLMEMIFAVGFTIFDYVTITRQRVDHYNSRISPDRLPASAYLSFCRVPPFLH